jgi:hypothetical protein
VRGWGTAECAAYTGMDVDGLRCPKIARPIASIPYSNGARILSSAPAASAHRFPNPRGSGLWLREYEPPVPESPREASSAAKAHVAISRDCAERC